MVSLKKEQESRKAAERSMNEREARAQSSRNNEIEQATIIIEQLTNKIHAFERDNQKHLTDKLLTETLRNEDKVSGDSHSPTTPITYSLSLTP